MSYFSRILGLICLLMPIASLYAEPKQSGFSEIYKVIKSETQAVYFITDNGTWLLKKDKLIKVMADVNSNDMKSNDTNSNGVRNKAQTLDVNAYRDLINNVQVQPKSIWQRAASVSYILLVVLFVIVYVYYQSSLNKRRKAYYERMKVQQQVLNIASLATGDEVLDCDIANNTINRINKNATIGLSNEVYFQSEAFIQTLHPDDKSIFLGHFESLMHSAKNNYEIEYRITDGNGKWIWLVERGCVIERDDNGEAKRLVSSMRDISLIKQEHENLVRLVSELERRLRTSEAALGSN